MLNTKLYTGWKNILQAEIHMDRVIVTIPYSISDKIRLSNPQEIKIVVRSTVGLDFIFTSQNCPTRFLARPDYFGY